MNIFSKLNADGKRALNAIKPAVNIAHAYAYLIHDTETSRKVGKHLYAKSEQLRVTILISGITNRFRKLIKIEC